MNPLIDIGSNLTHRSFADDLDRVLARAAAAGVTRQVVTGADLASSRHAAALAAQHPECLWSTAGVHPHHAASFDPAHAEEWTLLLAQSRVVAVGECGLDYFRDIAPREARHTELGFEGLERILATGREAGQASVAYWRPRVAASFGAANSPRFDTLRRFGLRRRPNEELLADWAALVEARLGALRLL